MKLATLLSGGKDSVYAAFLAAHQHQLGCAITIRSKNSESYMFHTPNIDAVKLQAQAIGIPLIIQETQGVKEEELDDLKQAIEQAVKEHEIQGIITGAVASQYQASRVQKICHELDIWCFNPLWQIDQVQLLQDLLEDAFEVMIAGVFAYPFDNKLLGKTITQEIIDELVVMKETFEINPAGEGGEIETFVTDCPLFDTSISVDEGLVHMDSQNSGVYEITKTSFENKPKPNVELKDFSLLTKEQDMKYNHEVTVISTVSKKHPLLDLEFIRPITDFLKQKKISFNVVHISDVKPTIKGRKFIISGTAIKDNEFLEHKEKIKPLFEKNLPILGICAGAELLGLHEGKKLEHLLEIGPHTVKSIKPHKFINAIDGKEQFFLHQYGFTMKEASTLNPLLLTAKGIGAFKIKDKPFYGVQFHPEVNEKKVLQTFIEEM